MRGDLVKRDRQLLDDSQVFTENAWDNVELSAEQEAQAQQLIDRQRQAMCTQPEHYASHAPQYWDQFYQRHEEKFFRDRHWFQMEFPELFNVQSSGSSSSSSSSSSGSSSSSSNSVATDGGPDNTVGNTRQFRILEVGCGVGNSVFPLLRHHRQHSQPGSYFIQACDFSPTAIELLCSNPEYLRGGVIHDNSGSSGSDDDDDQQSDSKICNINGREQDCQAFVCDLTAPQWPPLDANGKPVVEEGSVDVLTMIFVLSAITPQQMPTVVRRMVSLLKPGGLLLFRDYGRYDMAQLRFKSGRMLQENFYCRGDGTQVYFFTTEETERLFGDEAGLECVENSADRRLLVNRLRQLKMHRVWIQGKYRRRKPHLSL